MEETKYIIASHGSLARGFYTAIEMIIGSCENVKDYNLDEFASPYQILEELESEISSNQETQYVVFTDLLGGSVNNCLMCLCKFTNVFVISNVSLGLILTVILDCSEDDMNTKIERAITESSKTTMIFSRNNILSYSFCEKEEFI